MRTQKQGPMSPKSPLWPLAILSMSKTCRGGDYSRVQTGVQPNGLEKGEGVHDQDVAPPAHARLSSSGTGKQPADDEEDVDDDVI
jgi:hypothetical protein